MSELSRLMVKAVRSLPPEEQDALLEAMLEPRLAPWPDSPGPGLPSPDLLAGQASAHRVYGHEPRYEVSLPPIGPETGGPWQSVPVRLSTDQHERLKQWCQTNGFTMAVVLRGLVARFLDDQATRRPRPPGEGTGPPAGHPDPGARAPEPPAGQPGIPSPATGPPGGGA
jgi:hypothetical protein